MKCSRSPQTKEAKPSAKDKSVDVIALKYFKDLQEYCKSSKEDGVRVVKSFLVFKEFKQLAETIALKKSKRAIPLVVPLSAAQPVDPRCFHHIVTHESHDNRYNNRHVNNQSSRRA